MPLVRCSERQDHKQLYAQRFTQERMDVQSRHSVSFLRQRTYQRKHSLKPSTLDRKLQDSFANRQTALWTTEKGRKLCRKAPPSSGGGQSDVDWLFSQHSGTWSPPILQKIVNSPFFMISRPSTFKVGASKIISIWNGARTAPPNDRLSPIPMWNDP